MTTHSSHSIDRYVEAAARDYAAFVGGELEKNPFGGWCVSSKWEYVLFDREYVGTEHHYIPCRYSITKYAVTAHIHAYITGKGEESVDVVL